MPRIVAPLMRIGVLVGTVVAAVALLTGWSADAPAAPPSGAVKPTVVLVHGAWADTSSWDGEVSALQQQGYDVRAIANPLRNLTTDAESVADFLESLSGTIVLVG